MTTRLPFWELQRGGGPLNDLLIDREWQRLVWWAYRRAQSQVPKSAPPKPQPPTAEELAARARARELERDRTLVVQKVRPARRVAHEFTYGTAPDCWSIMQGRNTHMLDSGLRNWAAQLSWNI